MRAPAVIGAVALLAREQVPARSVARSPRVAAATAVVIGALALVGVLWQGGAIGSSSSSSGGSTQSSTGGVSGPYAPAGGSSSSSGGSSGGGSSGGGYGGY